MSEFSPTEAALEGLRISRERPVALVWWWAAYAASALLQIALSSLGPFQRMNALLPEMQSAYAAAVAQPTDTTINQHFISLFGQAAVPLTLFAAITLLLQMVLSTAMLRAVLRPAQSRFGYLRLSIDELRQLGLALLVSLAVIGYCFLVSIVSQLALGILRGLLGGALSSGVLGVVVLLLVIAALAYPAVRLSLAPAMTLADDRISFLRAWALTKGRFWPLLGAYAIAICIAGVLYLAVSVPVSVAMKLAGAPAGPAVLNSLRDLASPVSLAVFVVSSLLNALLSIVVTAPIASAYRQIGGRASPPAAAGATTGSPWT